MSNIGIFDPEGTNLNPINNKEYSENYKKMAKKWSNLPAYSKRQDIIDSLSKNNVLLVKSGTGSGKSVLVPKFVLHYLNYKHKLAMTLPKQSITYEAAKYAATTLDVELGKEIGYKYKGSPKNSFTSNTLILYATDGTIVNKLLKDPKLSEYSAIIVDEAHERKVQIDFLLYLLRNVFSFRKDFKLIIMSATINVDIFKTYFEEYKFAMIDISSKSNYHVESIYLQQSVDDYILRSYKIILDIVKKNIPGDILVFVTSVKETEELCKKVKDNNELSHICCKELYSGLSQEDQDFVINKDKYKSESKTRKLVIATEVAESSVTIDGIVFVIDSGKSLLGGYDAVKRARTLEKTFITKSQILQRKGRAGRTEPGVCYHLYTEKQFNDLIEYPEPAIRKNNIYEECLRLQLLPQIKTTENLICALNKFIEPPKESLISSSLMQLFELDIIKNNVVTDLGKIVVNIQTELPLGIALIYAHKNKCVKKMAKIIALHEACKGLFSNIFVNANDTKNNSHNNFKQKIDNAKKLFCSRSGDFISLYKIYHTASKNNKNLNEWCKSNFIKIKTILRAFYEYSKIRENLKKNEKMLKDFNENTNIENKQKTNQQTESIKSKLLSCLYQGFKNNTGKHYNSDLYKIKYSNNPVKIGNESLLNLSDKKPKNIFYGEYCVILGTEKLNMISKIK